MKLNGRYLPNDYIKVLNKHDDKNSFYNNFII